MAERKHNQDKRGEERGWPWPGIVLILLLCAAAAWAGVAAAHWQTPPEVFVEPPQIPVGASLPVEEPGDLYFSDDPKELRDFVFTRSIEGDWRAYIEKGTVHAFSAPGKAVVQDFDADLVRVKLVQNGEEGTPKTAWIWLEDALNLRDNQPARTP